MADEQVTTGSESLTPTPAQGNEQAPVTAATESPSTEQTERASIPAQPSVDRDAQILEMLDAGKPVSEVRKEITAAATPAANENQPAAETQSGEAKDASGSPVPSKAAVTPSYKDLDDRSRQQLSQAGLLPDMEEWNELRESTRQRILGNAQAIIAERTRLWQKEQALNQPRNQQGQFAPGKPGTTAGGEKPGQAVMDTSQGGTGAAAGTGGLKARLQKFVEMVGEDVAAPLIEGLEATQAEQTAALAQSAQREAERQNQMSYLLNRQIATEESSARATLAKDLPDLATPDNNEAWEIIKEEAKVLAQAAVNTGTDWSWQDCLEKAGRSLLSPIIAQQAQAKLADVRRTTLKNTPERGNQIASPARTASPEERDRLAMEMIDQGRTPQEVRMALAG
jgi:hypothetical protein